MHLPNKSHFYWLFSMCNCHFQIKINAINIDYEDFKLYIQNGYIFHKYDNFY